MGQRHAWFNQTWLSAHEWIYRRSKRPHRAQTMKKGASCDRPLPWHLIVLVLKRMLYAASWRI